MRRNRCAKIVATLGPASSTAERIRQLAEAGADVFRFNFSHGTHEDHAARFALVREVEAARGRPIGTIMDLQGPKLRVGRFAEGKVALVQGEPFRLDLEDAIGDRSRATLPHPEIFAVLQQGQDLLLDDGQRVVLAGFNFLVKEIPGHSPGSIVLIADQFEPPFAFVGDVLFAGSVGRTDFPGGSSEKLIQGIRKHLLSLPDATLVLSGHGPATTIGTEKRSNPFVGEHSGRVGLGW